MPVVRPISIVKTPDKVKPYTIHGLFLGKGIKLNMTEVVMLQSQLAQIIRTEARLMTDEY